MFPKPARSLEKYLPLFNKLKRKVVLDYGSGNLRNSVYLYRKGYEVFAVDLPHRIKLNSIPRLTCIWPEDLHTMQTKVNLVICTFVLNLVSPDNRPNLIASMARKMNAGGFLLIETKGLSLHQIDRLILPNEFIRIHNHEGRYTVIALYQRGNTQ